MPRSTPVRVAAEVAPKVGVGVTSTAGYAATVVGLIATLLAAIFPEVPEAELATVAGAIFTLGAFVVTQAGRYLQARDAIKVAGAVKVAEVQTAAVQFAQADRPPLADADAKLAAAELAADVEVKLAAAPDGRAGLEDDLADTGVEARLDAEAYARADAGVEDRTGSPDFDERF